MRPGHKAALHAPATPSPPTLPRLHYRSTWTLLGSSVLTSSHQGPGHSPCIITVLGFPAEGSLWRLVWHNSRESMTPSDVTTAYTPH